jgi:Apea-like HEPN
MTHQTITTSMGDKIQSALREAILQSLPTLNQLVNHYQQPSLVWTKQDDGSWRGEYQLRPDLFSVFRAAESQLNTNGADFTKLFFENHPKYNEMVCYGFGCCGLGYDKNRVFMKVISRIWDRNRTFVCDDAEVNNIIEEVVDFVDQPTIRYRFQSQLLNFQMTRETLELPENLTIRRLSEQEISDLYEELTKIDKIPGNEFVIEGEDEVPKHFDSYLDEVHPTEKIRVLLDKTILSLRSFKGGIVGYNHIRCIPIGFCPFGLGTHGRVNVFIPWGRYELLEDEITELNEYIKLIFKVSEPSMEMALNRLADAEIRTRPQDKIMDAVVGMEALLLAGLGKEDRRGELKYRFSIHFSTLFKSPQDRHNAFRIAKDLYDLRSTIAHGSSLTRDKFRIGAEKDLNLIEASKRATENLRMVIQYFLPKVGSATYKNHEFWERAYFNLEGTSLDTKDVQTSENKP